MTVRLLVNCDMVSCEHLDKYGRCMCLDPQWKWTCITGNTHVLECTSFKCDLPREGGTTAPG